MTYTDYTHKREIEYFHIIIWAQPYPQKATICSRGFYGAGCFQSSGKNTDLVSTDLQQVVNWTPVGSLHKIQGYGRKIAKCRVTSK